MEQNPLWEDNNVDSGAAVAAPKIPFWERYTLTIQEAAAYFRIGENKLRKIVSEDQNADYILWNGNRPQIKRRLFENYIDKLSLI